MAGVDAGVLVSCPSCGLTVLQKAMVPVLTEPAVPGEAAPMGYICIPCARKRIALPVDAT